jgi:serine/threonine-protein kinase
VPQSPRDEEPLSPTVLGRIDEDCDRFEDAWQAGEQPRLEDFLEGAEGPERQARLRRLLVVELVYRRGEAPSKDEYRQRFPDGLEAIDDAFATAASSARQVDGPADTVPYQGGAAGRNGMRAPAGRYRLGAEIARGGMGVVLRAYDAVLDRDVAVKVVHPDLAGSPEALLRFVREAQLAGRLQHPGVAPVYDLGTLPDGRAFLAMKLIEGRALHDLLKERPDPGHDLPRFLRYFESVCQAVGYAHARGVLHRDLKPGNIMVGAFGEAQVMDWGLAKDTASREPQRAEEGPGGGHGAVGPEETQTGDALGTYAYMAPEQARGEVAWVDARSDVFGLGAILCEVLAGKPPFVGKDVMQQAKAGDLAGAFARLDGCEAEAELIALAKACLAPEQNDRPRDGGAVAEEVAAHLAGAQERLKQAELERAAAEAREQEERAKVEAERRAVEAERRAVEAERQAVEARAQEARATAVALAAAAVAERKRRRRTVALAALLLVVLGGAVGWRWQRQRAEAGTRALLAVERGRPRLKEGWQEHDLAKLKEVKAEADRAVDIASGADEAVRRQVADFQEEAKQRLARAEKNQALMAALANVASPRETRAYEADESGRMTAVAELSADQQYARAFRRWGLDLERTPEDEVVARLQDEPAPVVQEVLAALDAWMFRRRWAQLSSARGQKAPEGEWGRLVRLADRLDDSPTRRRLRALLARGARPQVGTAARMSVAAAGLGQPWAALAPLGPRGEERALRGKINPAREPALTVLLLARLSEIEWDHAGAEAVLRQAVTARPNEVVLLDGLAGLLMRQGRPAEAVEFYRGARAVRPQLGGGLARALGQAGRPAEGEGVLRELVDRSPDNPEWPFHLGQALGAQKKHAEAEAACRQAIDLKRDYPEAHVGLGVALKAQGRFTEALWAYRQGHALGSKVPGWPYPSAAWVRHAERLVSLDQLLPKVLDGTSGPASAAEALELASLCQLPSRGLHAAAARLAADAFTADPKLAADLDRQHRYNAACSAALAGCGQGKDAGALDARERARWRRQALTWLRADLAVRRKQLQSWWAGEATRARQALAFWQFDADLAGLRDSEALARLPAEERAACARLWADVADLLRKARKGK